MGLWWRLRQWVYAHPPVAAAGAVGLLAIAGLGGWESARFFVEAGATPTAGAVTHQVAAANTIRVEVDAGAPVDSAVTRTRTSTQTRTVVMPGSTNTVVVTRPATRIVPTVLVRTTVKTVRNGRTQTVVRQRTVTQTVDNTRTVRETVTLSSPEQSATQTPPGQVAKGRPTRTVTVVQTQTVTQPAATVTVTVTTSKGGH